MKRIKQTLLSLMITTYLVIGLLSFSFIPINAASSPSDLDVKFNIPNPSKYNNIEDIINAGTSIAKVIFILTFAGVILYGGFIRLTSQGDEKKVEQSTKTITAGIVGFAIIVFAQPISEFIAKVLGVQGGLFSKV